ncbi:MAG: serine/threonine protein kinase [Planctomycetes bacterium]|nr:serine/threonine protein kinase [Planctomycetota bacterium]
MGFFDRLTGAAKGGTSKIPKETSFAMDYEHVKDLLPGAMSTIAQVRHKQSKRLFCIKKVRPATEQARKKLERELEVSFDLVHENIGRTIAWQRSGAETWILMEWIEGPSFRSFMRDWYMTKEAKPPLLSGRDFATVFAQAARALQYVHGKGFLHLDVKPENFLASGLRSIAEVSSSRSKDTQIFKKEVLQQAGAILVKLIDFGISIRLDEPKVNLGGSPLYVAPEIVGGVQSQALVGPCSDIWSLGAMMYEIACGRPPYLPAWFEGKTKHWQALWGEYDSQDPTVKKAYDQELLKKRRDVPADMARLPYSDSIKAIVKKCLEIAPGRRFTSCAALVSELEKFL